VRVLALVLALTVDLVLPRYRRAVGSGDCASIGPALTNLDSIYVFATPNGAPLERLIYSLRVRHCEGYTLTFQVPDDPSSLRIYTTNTDHVRSCDFFAWASSQITTDVPVVKAQADSLAVWYDVAGRRLRSAPKTPGVYVRVRGQERRKIVVLK
jgi:hypothetical protein